MTVRVNVVDEPKQEVKFTTNGVVVTIGLIYNYTDNNWFIDVTFDNEVIVVGRRLVSNVDLIPEYANAAMICFNASLNDDVITYRSLIIGDSRLFVSFT